MKLKIALAPLACISLAACHIPGMPGGGKAPSGQVVATVDGDEITLAQLRAEMAGAGQPPNAQAAKAMQEAALQQIIVRKLLAQAAHEQKLDKTPEFAVQKARSEETLLAQLMERQYATSVPVVPKADAETFVSEHPAQFANRKVYTVDQLRIPLPQNPAELQELQPLHSLAEVEALATRKGWDYQRSVGVIDTASTPPQIVDQLDKLPPGEPFILPGGGAAIVNAIRDSKAAPLTGDTAVAVAMSAIRNQKLQQAVGKSVEALVKSKTASIKYNDAYKPAHPLGAPEPKPAAAAPAAAPAPKS